MYLKSDKELKTKLQMAEFELLVPANNILIAKKAINAGADAVYIGYSKYGARAQAGNSLEDLIEIIEYAHIYNVKIYITLNTILNNDEISQAEKLIWKLYKIKADGIIIQDMGILECKLPPIPIIASTQCHNNTLEKVKFLEKTGFKRVILPREISLDEIKEISKNTEIELECFIQGALCMSYSGQCYLSYAIGGRSANRGECAQPCRKKYSLKDADGKIIIKNKHILSLKDLNLSEKLEDLILSGITSFKIEGRLKNESYVINNTVYYRKLLDKILSKYNLKKSSAGKINCDFEPDLCKTFNRGYTDFYINNTKNNIGTVNYTSSLGEYIGTVSEIGKNYFKCNSYNLKNGDGICFFNENNELIGTNVNKTDGNCIYPASFAGIKKGLKIYRNYDKNFEDIVKNSIITRKISAKIKIREIELGILFLIIDENNNCASYMINNSFEKAISPEKTLETMKLQFAKSGGTEFFIKEIDIRLKKIPFMKISKINEIRRILIEKLRKIRRKNYKYQYRKEEIKVVNYPILNLDYKANIYNDKAALFYEKRGSFIKERALEAQSNLKNRELMISKYCIKNQLNLCPKQNKKNSYKEPYVLIDEFNKEYLVEFNCKDCIMKIKSKN